MAFCVGTQTHENIYSYTSNQNQPQHSEQVSELSSVTVPSGRCWQRDFPCCCVCRDRDRIRFDVFTCYQHTLCPENKTESLQSTDGRFAKNSSSGSERFALTPRSRRSSAEETRCAIARAHVSRSVCARLCPLNLAEIDASQFSCKNIHTRKTPTIRPDRRSSQWTTTPSASVQGASPRFRSSQSRCDDDEHKSNDLNDPCSG